MNAAILSVGDELALGQTVDTNSAWLSAELAAVGCDVAAHMTVGDDQAAIEAAMKHLAALADVLIVSGGIGPTADDLTRQALANVLGEPLEMDAEWLAHLDTFFKARGREMPEINQVQAMIPRGARKIFNYGGTAAGIRAVYPMKPAPFPPARERSAGAASSEATRQMFGQLSAPVGTFGADRLNATVFCMPGVPKEMKAMFTRDVLPPIARAAGGAVILSRTLHTFGVGESVIGERLGDLMRRGRNPSVGTTVANGFVSLRVNARFPSRGEAERELAGTVAECRRVLGDLIFGVDDQTLMDSVADLLKQDGNLVTVATAESCTGGLVAKMLTDLPGSSTHFQFGWVTYADHAKTELLGVPAAMIEQHGAVSEPVVRSMAAGALSHSNSQYAIAISGIAGPGGGTHDKPVGTVWIAVGNASDTTARRLNFPGDRAAIRDRSAKTALTMLRYRLLNKPLPF